MLCHCLLFQVRFGKNPRTFVASVATFTFSYQCELYNVRTDSFTNATNIAISAVDFCLKKNMVVLYFFLKNNDNETPKWCLYCEKYEYSLQYLYEFEVELETAAHPSWEISVVLNGCEHEVISIHWHFAQKKQKTMTKHTWLPFCSQRVQEKDSLNKINKPIWSCNLQSRFVCFFRRCASR